MEKQEYLKNLFEALDKELAEFDLSIITPKTEEMLNLENNLVIDYKYQDKQAFKCEINNQVLFEFFKKSCMENYDGIVSIEEDYILKWIQLVGQFS